jgi:hypothetical protein
MVSEGSGGPFATLTHARLRAAQGDVAGAVRILRVILAAQPDHDEAREALDALQHRVDVTYLEPPPIEPEEAMPAAAADLAARFRDALGAAPHVTRAARLDRWIRSIRRNRGARRVR